MEKIAIIMRGVPGSGKSTIATWFEQMGAIVCSTDNYHIVNGEYKFNAEKLGEFHRKNLEYFTEHVQKGTQMVIVDNTNVKRKDYLSYVEEARDNGYEVHAITFVPQDIEKCIKRNVHKVPEEAVRRMASSLQASIENKEHEDFDKEFLVVT